MIYTNPLSSLVAERLIMNSSSIEGPGDVRTGTKHAAERVYRAILARIRYILVGS